jgi:hypothetical protein
MTVLGQTQTFRRAAGKDSRVRFSPRAGIGLVALILEAFVYEALSEGCVIATIADAFHLCLPHRFNHKVHFG